MYDENTAHKASQLPVKPTERELDLNNKSIVSKNPSELAAQTTFVRGLVIYQTAPLPINNKTR